MVVISKKFHNPEIRYSILADGLMLELPLADYLQAVLLHLGSPIALLTRKQLSTRLQAASQAVLQDMKDATIHHPPNDIET